MPVTFAPGGNSDSFTQKNFIFPEDLAGYLNAFNLNGYEFECGRGVNISNKTFEKLPVIASDNNIYLTLHAPYFISLSSTEEETRKKSIHYIYQAASAAHMLKIKKIVVHAGSCAKISRETALFYAKDTLKKAQDKLDAEGMPEIIICPETLGKINQLGTLTEVLDLCGADERFIPCIDFGHLNARTHGGIKNKDDYKSIFDETEKIIGVERTKNLHIHFSKIEYTAGGEKKHLTFSVGKETGFGPDYRPLLEIIKEREYEPSIVCESNGTQAEDCAEMKAYYESL